MSRVAWAVIAVSLLAGALWLNDGTPWLGFASGLVGFAAGWVFAARVLP